jgi:mono/diheme cytochrome c family protein
MRIQGFGLAVFTAVVGMAVNDLSGSSVAVAQSDKTETVDGSSGRELYLSVGCYQCHGRAGQGGLAGPPLASSMLPYTAFAEVTRNPRWNMPPYSQKSLPDEELQKIYEYVRELSR